jgi:hypothetical protein
VTTKHKTSFETILFNKHVSNAAHVDCNQAFECFLHPTKTAIMTTNPSLLLYAQTSSAITTSTHAIILLPFNQDDPAITMTNHANSKLQLIVEYLLLSCDFERPAITMTVNTRNLLPFFVQNDPEITIANSLQMIVEYLLLSCNFERPAITMATHAEYSLQLIVESLILLCNEDNSETMASSLFLFCVKDAPAIMMATHADYSLQLIVESLFTGAKLVASATISNGSSMLIVI